jgi:hypothetical protein
MMSDPTVDLDTATLVTGSDRKYRIKLSNVLAL